jgi:hypothetical protein
MEHACLFVELLCKHEEQDVNVCLWTTCLSDWAKGRDGLGNLPLKIQEKVDHAQM